MTHALQLKTSKDLGWKRVLMRIAAHCRSEQGTERVMARMPFSVRGEATHAVGLAAEAMAALRLGKPVPRSQIPPLEVLLTRVDRGAEVDAIELRQVVTAVETAAQLERFLADTKEGYPLLHAELDFPPGLHVLADRIDACIEPSGRMRDAASSELKRARAAVRKSRSSLLSRLKSLARRYGDVLRDGGPVERDGRYGLAVRSDAHRRVDGIVLGSSSTGATLYVEPPEITQLANALRLAQSDVEREVLRILRVLRSEVAAKSDGLHAAYEACIRADVLGAIAHWGSSNRAVSIAPGEDALVSLERMRHPLLGEDVVPTSLRLDAGHGLILSGPNAGGKTVGLKCLGLAVWLSKSGLPVPADPETKVGWFESVHSDMGDGQSIERSLSSFSAEVELLSAMLEQVGPKSLVLLDEVAGGTDPEQGAALAASILEALLDAGAAVAATTHYELLKDLASNSSRMENASVGFDFKNMRPTFEMTQGLPGASSAFVVALRHGLPPGVVDDARGRLNMGARARDELLEQLAQERADLATKSREAESQLNAVTELRAQLENELREQQERGRKKLGQEAEKLKSQVQQARSQLRAMTKQMASGERLDRKKSEKKIDQAAALLRVGGALDGAIAEPRAKAETPASVTVGMRVYVPKFRLHAEVQKVEKNGQIRLLAGSMTLRAKLSELELSDAPEGAPKKERRANLSPSRSGAVQERMVRSESNTCNLRGMRVPEAIEVLERFVDSLLRTGERYGYALHGHGSGILKKAIREHLDGWPVVAEQRPAKQSEGGDAFTLILIR